MGLKVSKSKASSGREEAPASGTLERYLKLSLDSGSNQFGWFGQAGLGLPELAGHGSGTSGDGSR